jgi:hypothetical protein
MVEDRLGERYLRLDAPWPQRAGLGLDVATPAAARVLAGLARETLRDTEARQLEPFLAT